MTAEEWNEVKKLWESSYFSLNFEIDGYKVSLYPTIYKGRFFRQIFIDGWMKGEWLNKENEMAKRFLNITERSLYSKKEIEATRKAFGKRFSNDMMEKKYTVVHQVWASFSSFKKHIIANNQEIKYIANN